MSYLRCDYCGDEFEREDRDCRVCLRCVKECLNEKYGVDEDGS